MCSEIVAPTSYEIHDQERNVADDVDMTKIGVEFDAVECSNAARQSDQVCQV